MRRPMASSIRRSSSFLVIIITGTLGSAILICSKVESPSNPGIISSSSTMSKGAWAIRAMASLPLLTGVTA